MQRMICIPAERYYKMLEAYDQAVEELEQLKKALKELADSSKGKDRVTRQHNKRPDTDLIISYIRPKIKSIFAKEIM